MAHLLQGRSHPSPTPCPAPVQGCVAEDAAGSIRVADWGDFRQESHQLRRYVEEWTEESEAARMYNMLQYESQEKVQAEEQ